jgi:2-C-methyl-D-erythritol 4-phosphate cytidylyltransferase
MRRHVSAIVLAAGRSLRFKSKIPKPLAKVNSKPVIMYSLDTLSLHPSVTDIIVVTNDKNSKEITDIIAAYRLRKIRRMVKGGERRQDSVRNALCVLDSRTDFVLIHDAARPFVDKDIVSRLIKEASRSGAAIVGVPVKATLKEVRSSKFIVHSKGKNKRAGKTPMVLRTLDRGRLWEIQTPQVFRKDLIFRAYKRFGRLDVTDDAMLVEKLGARVSIVPGTSSNIKITTPEDLVIAQALLKSRLGK